MSSIDQSKVIPAPIGSASGIRSNRSIGSILIHSGRLTFENADRILQLQREKGLLFGEAAIQLGLLTQDDIEFALARQFDYPLLIPGTSKVSESVVAAYGPKNLLNPAVFGALRSQLMLRWFDGDPARKALAIISGEAGEGRSFVTSNLAVAFAQLGLKTLLIDADLRAPTQHLLFGIENRNGLSTILCGRDQSENLIQRIPGLPSLSILPSGVTPPNPLELLSRPPFTELLRKCARDFDVILLDSPCAGQFPDAQLIAIGASAAIIIARKNHSHVWRVRGVSDKVSNISTTILGTVLNDF